MSTLDITLKLRDDLHVPKLYKFKRGSFGPNSAINFTIQNKDGSAKDITGLTLTMKLYEIWKRIPLVENVLTIVVAANGTAKYEPIDGDFNIIKYYYLRVSLEDSNNNELTEEVLFEIQ